MKTKISICLSFLVVGVLLFQGTRATTEETVTTTERTSSETPAEDNSYVATFAGGCFWGIENKFIQKFGNETIISSQVGYTGGSTTDPKYEDVCKGTTGHAEAVQFKYDPKGATYEEMVLFFWRIHDSTTLNRQGNDKGTQYRSAVFYHTSAQKDTAEKVREIIKPKFKDPVVTEIVAATTFYPAEEYHQHYLQKNPNGYCNHKLYWS